MRTVASGKENQLKIQEGVNLIGNAVRLTLGPKGKLAMLESGRGEYFSTKDGYLTAWHVQSKDPIVNAAISLLREATSKTNREAGDGTTTSTLLAQEIYNAGSKALETVENQTEFFKGIDYAAEQVIKSLKSQAIQVAHDDKEIAFVARIATNNDVELGDLIAVAMKSVGKDGTITVEESPTSETYFKKEEGFEIDNGMVIPNFSTNFNKLTAELPDCYVLLVDGELSKFNQLVDPLNQFLAANQTSPILVIANDINGDCLGTMSINYGSGKLKICAVKTPGFKTTHKRWLDDIAVATGATVISDDDGTTLKNFNVAMLGRCSKVTVTQNKTIFVNGQGSVEAHVEALKSQLADATEPTPIDVLKNRIARFTGGVGVIYLGASTALGLREKRDRMDDALNAVKAAVAEGYVVGGGKSLWNACASMWVHVPETTIDFRHGFQVVSDSICQPMKQLMGTMPIERIQEAQLSFKVDDISVIGYNAYTDKVENLIEAGVIDPVKVVRCALENAVDVAKILLRTDFTSVHDFETVKNAE